MYCIYGSGNLVLDENLTAAVETKADDGNPVGDLHARHQHASRHLSQ